MHEHPCIKCGTKYQDSDPEAYYCPACLIEKKRIAAELDKKPRRPSKPVQSIFKPEDFIGKNGRKFFSAKELGI